MDKQEVFKIVEEIKKGCDETKLNGYLNKLNTYSSEFTFQDEMLGIAFETLKDSKRWDELIRIFKAYLKLGEICGMMGLVTNTKVKDFLEIKFNELGVPGKENFHDFLDLLSYFRKDEGLYNTFKNRFLSHIRTFKDWGAVYNSFNAFLDIFKTIAMEFPFKESRKGVYEKVKDSIPMENLTFLELLEGLKVRVYDEVEKEVIENKKTGFFIFKKEKQVVKKVKERVLRNKNDLFNELMKD